MRSAVALRFIEQCFSHIYSTIRIPLSWSLHCRKSPNFLVTRRVIVRDAHYLLARIYPVPARPTAAFSVLFALFLFSAGGALAGDCTGLLEINTGVS